MDRRTAARSNGGVPSPSADIYKQLIDNDMVKELDDIEAISQQISQHAEVLYNSWKSNNNNNSSNSNGVSQPQGGLGPAPQLFRQSGELSGGGSISPSPGPPLYRELRERGGAPVSSGQHEPPPSRSVYIHSGPPRTNGHSSGGGDPGGSYGSLDRLTVPPRFQGAGGFSTHSLDRQLPNQFRSWEPSQPPTTAGLEQRVYSPGPEPLLSKAGSSITQISGHNHHHHHPQPPVQTDVGPLELLASPTLSGNLEELVTSFVSTDRAKQAARNTISSTIMRRLGGSPTTSNGSASPVRSPSPTLSYKAASPLRSPMLTSSLLNEGAGLGGGSPRASIASMFPNETAIPISGGMSLSPSTMIPIIPFSTNEGIHAPMQSIFSPNNSLSSNSPQHSRPVAVIRPKVIRDEPDDRPIPIPVKIVTAPVNSTSPSASEGLKSPLALQAVTNHGRNPFQFPLSLKPSATMLSDVNEPMSNLFDEFGTVRDPDANLLSVRRRFEEAKQRMALSLPAREGGMRPNSFMGRNPSLFDSPGWAEDPSSFLLEQLRRRKLRRMEAPPAAPHPELTPTQRQHIIERSAAGAPGASLGSGGGAGGMQVPIRRMLPGGSVAERVLMFENSPSIFGLEPSQAARTIPQRREPTATGTAITPWRSQLHEQHSKLQQVGAKNDEVPILRRGEGGEGIDWVFPRQERGVCCKFCRILAQIFAKIVLSFLPS